MSNIRDAIVRLIQMKESGKNMGSWTLADLAAHITFYYSLAVDEYGTGKVPFVSCGKDSEDDEKVVLQRWKGAPRERVGCMDVIKILDGVDAWSNPYFVQAVSRYLINLIKQDT